MKANYHTHTSRCHHAEGTDEDYIKSAILGGFDILGFSDHAPWPYTTGFVSETRMLLSELPDYVSHILELKEKYKDQIEIHVGLECEYYPQMISWLSEIKEKYPLEYLLFGNHHYPSEEEASFFGMCTTDVHQLHRYEKSLIEGMQTGLYTYVAHPDLFMGAYPTFDKHCEEVSRNICREANKLHLPIEYNLGCAAYCEMTGESLFPHPAFWEIAKEEGCTAIIGVDAHAPYNLATQKYYDKAVETLRMLGIPRLEKLDL